MSSGSRKLELAGGLNQNDSGCRASFSPTKNLSDLPCDALCSTSVQGSIPLHLQSYQHDYCYDSSQLRYLIINVLKRIEKRFNKKLRLISDIFWANDEKKHQKKATEELHSSYLEKLSVHEELQARKNELECIGRYVVDS